MKPLDIAAFWRPNPPQPGRPSYDGKSPQELFWEIDCDEALYGGQAGGGKSGALVALPLQIAHQPRSRTLIFRREFRRLKDLLDKAADLYPLVCPAVRHKSSPYEQYIFPLGAEAAFVNCEAAEDWRKYQGWEVNYLLFDELTEFLEAQYTGITSRARSPVAGVPVKIRATTNPGGIGHPWVFKRWGAWLDPNFMAEGLTERTDETGKLPPARPGEVWHIWLDEEGHEHYSREPVFDEDGKRISRSRTFIPAALDDNPHADVNYGSVLANIDDRVLRLQLRDGNWLVKAIEGALFKGSRRFIKLPPADRVAWCMAYGADLAYTASTKADWSVILQGYMFGRDLYIVGMQRKQVEATAFLLTMKALLSRRRGVIRWYIGGGGEKGVASFMALKLMDEDGKTWFRALPATADKRVRATPASLLWNPPVDDDGNPRLDENDLPLPGHILVPAEDSPFYGPWVEELLAEVLAFTGDPKIDENDDIVDALAALHDECCNTRQITVARERMIRHIPTMS